MIPLIVNGATGRMGRRVVALSAADPERRTTVLAGVTIPDDPLVGTSVNGIPVVDRFDKALCFATAGIEDRVVVVDFTSPDGLAGVCGAALDNGLALVSGTTGLTQTHREALHAAAEKIPVLWAPNMSLGIHLLEHLVSLAARSLGQGVEVEIEETHHRHKADAPSGTAARLAELVLANARPGSGLVHGRSGVHPGGRTPTEIGIHSIRMGEVVGDHAVHFALDHEIVTLSHRALSRDAFAAGALAAARFLATAEAGLYTMDHVLGFHR
jgi:4-hydroxy-tetrahydrodipicolinate reductase